MDQKEPAAAHVARFSRSMGMGRNADGRFILAAILQTRRRTITHQTRRTKIMEVLFILPALQIVAFLLILFSQIGIEKENA